MKALENLLFRWDICKNPNPGKLHFYYRICWWPSFISNLWDRNSTEKYRIWHVNCVCHADFRCTMWHCPWATTSQPFNFLPSNGHLSLWPNLSTSLRERFRAAIQEIKSNNSNNSSLKRKKRIQKALVARKLAITFSSFHVKNVNII